VHVVPTCGFLQRRLILRGLSYYRTADVCPESRVHNLCLNTCWATINCHITENHCIRFEQCIRFPESHLLSSVDSSKSAHPRCGPMNHNEVRSP